MSEHGGEVVEDEFWGVGGGARFTVDLGTGADRGEAEERRGAVGQLDDGEGERFFARFADDEDGAETTLTCPAADLA